MSQRTFTSLRILGGKSRFLFSNSSSAVNSKVSVAYITGRSSRIEPEETPKPWPYLDWGYSNWIAPLDGTKKRIGENSKVIVVEGLPCIGKSTLARALAEELEMKYFPMVTSNSYYINQYGYDLRSIDHEVPKYLRVFDELDFVKNPKSDQIMYLQVLLHIQKFRQYMDALAHVLNTGQGVVLDRCVYSDSVFANTLLDMGYISKTEREAYQQLHNRGVPDLMKPHLIVYLDAPVSVVEQNLKKRGLGEEKVWNKEMLERLDYHYKYDYLKKITEHAELVAYDWATPGDAEVIVEDIERIDFDRFGPYDPKMEDWRIRQDADWSEKRWEFTSQQSDAVVRLLVTPALCHIPAVVLRGEDGFDYANLFDKIPGNQYQPGFNAALGDKVPFFWNRAAMAVWEDHPIGKPTKKQA